MNNCWVCGKEQAYINFECVNEWHKQVNIVGGDGVLDIWIYVFDNFNYCFKIEESKSVLWQRESGDEFALWKEIGIFSLTPEHFKAESKEQLLNKIQTLINFS